MDVLHSYLFSTHVVSDYIFHIEMKKSYYWLKIRKLSPLRACYSTVALALKLWDKFNDHAKSCKVKIMFIVATIYPHLGKNDPCYGYRCPEGHTCKISRHGEPFCSCGKTCASGEHFTGPVCGRDGVEYINLCKLRHASCNTQDEPTVKNYGKCESLMGEQEMTRS